MTLRKNTRIKSIVVPLSDPHTEPEFVELLGSATFNFPDQRPYKISIENLPYPQIAKALLASNVRIFNSRGSERHQTVKARVTAIQVFCKLAARDNKLFTTLQALTGDDLEWFENAITKEYPNGRSALTYYANFNMMLQECSTVMDLREDLKYRTIRPAGNLPSESSPFQSYSRDEFAHIQEAAYLACQSVITKFSKDPMEDTNEMTRELLRYFLDGGENLRVGNHYYTKLQKNDVSIEQTYYRIYPNTDDLLPFIVLLTCLTGWNAGVVTGLKADCLISADKGKIGVETFKARRGGKAHETLYVRDGGLKTPGGVIRAVLDITSRYRDRMNEPQLFLCAGNGIERSVSTTEICRKITMDKFVNSYNLKDNVGKTLHLQLTRLRKTVKLQEYVETNGVVSLMKGHSATVAARHYANLPQSIELHLNALTGAIGTVLEVTQTPAPAIEEQTLVAGCKDKMDSPYTPKGQTCLANPAFCFTCPNAHISLDNLPGVLTYVDYMVGQSVKLEPTEWVDVYGANWIRIHGHILPHFNAAQVETATMMKQPTVTTLAFEVLGSKL